MWQQWHSGAGILQAVHRQHGRKTTACQSKDSHTINTDMGLIQAGPWLCCKALGTLSVRKTLLSFPLISDLFVWLVFFVMKCVTALTVCTVWAPLNELTDSLGKGTSFILFYHSTTTRERWMSCLPDFLKWPQWTSNCASVNQSHCCAFLYTSFLTKSQVTNTVQWLTFTIARTSRTSKCTWWMRCAQKAIAWPG